MGEGATAGLSAVFEPYVIGNRTFAKPWKTLFGVMLTTG